MGRVLLHDSKKLTMGRRKIEIKKIQKKTSLQVTFTKRRTGLFKKAGELSVLCGSDVSIIVRSPANKVYAFGTPSVERVFHRYEMGASFVADDHHCTGLGDHDAAKRREYEKAVRKLQEKKMEMIRALMGHEIIDENGFWWDQQIIEGIMEVLELEEYLESLEDLRNKVSCRIEEMEIKEKQLPPT
ncbi:MADS-box transcription factor 23-like [Henckelia pumila]|uniref:MADS-box transcription factor 23-like n=1 Tax=Henckelia pumila TaxID=405737 RepID=UPI003C6E1C20